MQNIFIASDHAGYELKEFLKTHFLSKFSVEFSFEDLGTHSKVSVDYPDFSDALAIKLKSSTTKFGILICGSGVGVCIRANRYMHVRAVQVWNEDIAKLSREHNDANVICFGERAQTREECAKLLEIFLNTKFLDSSAGDASSARHLRRVQKLSSPIF